LLLDDLADWSLLSSSLLRSYRIFVDCLVCSLVVVLEGLTLKFFLPLAELPLEGFRIVLLKQIIVLLDMDTEDVFLMLLYREFSFSLCLLFFLLASLVSLFFGLDNAVSWESLLIVRDKESTVTCTFHGAEDTVSSGCANETDIEICLKWSPLTNVVLD